MSATCSCHSQVMMDGPCRMNSQAAVPPVAGTEPAPCQPMQAVRQPLVPSGGNVAAACTVRFEASVWTP